jgi:thiamine-monophosphate kinase
LTGDLGHILDASNAGARIELARLPCLPALAARMQGVERELALACVLSGGDDYELCFTAPPAQRDAVAALEQDAQVALTRIGTITAAKGLVIEDETGAALRAVPKAFDHFG